MAYNRVGGRPQPGVAGSISAVAQFPVVAESLAQVASAAPYCRRRSIADGG
jgi:hypothetical protein